MVSEFYPLLIGLVSELFALLVVVTLIKRLVQKMPKTIILHCLDAIFKSQNALNSKFSGAPPRTPLGELTALPQTP